MASKKQTAVATENLDIVTADGKPFRVGDIVHVVETEKGYNASFDIREVSVIAIDPKQRMVYFRLPNGKETGYNAEGISSATEVFASRKKAVERVTPIAERFIANADAEADKKHQYATSLRDKWDAVRKGKPVPNAASDD